MYVNFLFCVAILNFYDVVWFELLETFRFQDKDDYKGEVFSILSSALACVADALNLLYIDYTKGLDECVGRLQRRLVVHAREPASFWRENVIAFVIVLRVAEKKLTNAGIVIIMR